jgi:hypothetical protein
MPSKIELSLAPATVVSKMRLGDGGLWVLECRIKAPNSNAPPVHISNPLRKTLIIPFYKFFINELFYRVNWYFY